MARALVIRHVERVIGGFEIEIERTEAYARRGVFSSQVGKHFVDESVFINGDGSLKGRAQMRNALTAWLATEEGVKQIIEGATL